MPFSSGGVMNLPVSVSDSTLEIVLQNIASDDTRHAWQQIQKLVESDLIPKHIMFRGDVSQLIRYGRKQDWAVCLMFTLLKRGANLHRALQEHGLVQCASQILHMKGEHLRK